MRKYRGSTSGVGTSTAAVHPRKATDQRIVTRRPVIDQHCVARRNSPGHVSASGDDQLRLNPSHGSLLALDASDASPGS
jgi:hypothetical protein